MTSIRIHEGRKYKKIVELISEWNIEKQPCSIFNVAYLFFMTVVSGQACAHLDYSTVDTYYLPPAQVSGNFAHQGSKCGFKFERSFILEPQKLNNKSSKTLWSLQ